MIANNLFAARYGNPIIGSQFPPIQRPVNNPMIPAMGRFGMQPGPMPVMAGQFGMNGPVQQQPMMPQFNNFLRMRAGL